MLYAGSMLHLARPDASPIPSDEPRETSPAESAAPMDGDPADPVRRVAAVHHEPIRCRADA